MPQTKLDNTDPSVKLMGENWAQLSDPNLFDGTVLHTRFPGASFTIAFTGVSISIFGRINANTTPLSTYAIDNGASTLFDPAMPNPQDQFNQEFFQSDELSLGDHTLFVKNEGDWFLFDYFIIETPDSSPTSQPPPNPPPPNSPTTSPPPATTPQTNPPSTNSPQTDPPQTSSSQTTTQSPQKTAEDQTKLQTNSQVTQSTPPLITTIIADGQTSSQNTSAGPQNPSPSGLVASPTDTSSVSSISRLSTAAIAGVVVGAVIAITTVLILLYCFYRKRRKAGNESRSEVQPTLTPFDGRRAVHSQGPRSRSRKNGIHSIEYVIPIETRQPQASGSGSSGTFREREHPEVNDSRQFEEQQSSTIWSGTYGYNPPPAYDQLSSLPVAL